MHSHDSGGGGGMECAPQSAVGVQSARRANLASTWGCERRDKILCGCGNAEKEDGTSWQSLVVECVIVPLVIAFSLVVVVVDCVRVVVVWNQRNQEIRQRSRVG